MFGKKTAKNLLPDNVKENLSYCDFCNKLHSTTLKYFTNLNVKGSYEDSQGI